MILKVVVLLALFLPIVQSHVHGADWYYVGDGNSGQHAILYDKDSIKRNGTRVKIWTWIIFKNYEPQFNNGNAAKQYWEFNCKEDTQELIYGVIYRDGNVVFTEKGSSKEARPVIPGSFDGVFQHVACGKQSKSIRSGNVNESDVRNTIWKQGE